MLGVPIARLTVQPISKDDLAMKEVIDKLTSYNMSIAVFFAKKNHKYPTLDMEETQGLTTDIFDMECAKHAVNQYESELSMPEAEIVMTKIVLINFYQLSTCYCHEERE